MRLLTLLTTTALALTLTQLAGGGQVDATQELLKSRDAMSQTLAQADSREVEADHLFQADRLFQQGLQQYRVSQYREALQSWEQALELYGELGARVDKAVTLYNIGEVNSLLQNYLTALDYYEQSLLIRRELGDRAGEANTLINMGNVYSALGDYSEALNYYEQSLTIDHVLGNQAGVAIGLVNIGGVYEILGNYSEALDSLEQSLSLARELGLQAVEAASLGNIGNIHSSIGNFPQALDYYEQSLPLFDTLEDRAGEADALNNIGTIHEILGNYSTALEYFEQSLTLKRSLQDQAGEANTLNNIGVVYLALGNHPEALDYFEQSLIISKALGMQAEEANAFGNIGYTYQLTGNYSAALEYLDQSLTLAQALETQDMEAYTLNDIGNVYEALGNYSEALKFYENSLDLFQSLGIQVGEAKVLNNIGVVYRALGNYSEALNSYEQSLILTQAIDSPPEEALTLGNIGRILNVQGQPELAIIFLKASVEVRESIRAEIRDLDVRLQQSYTNTVDDNYRLLADLLLEQGRIPEAQQVLDLLKLEELREFTDTRAAWTGSELTYTDPEQQVIDAHGSLIALSGEVITCEDVDCAELDSLYDQLDELTAQYNQQVEQFQETIRTNRADDDVFQDPANLSGEAEALLTAYAQDGQQAVLIYPFVLEDKLWLVWAAAGNVIGSVEVPVTQAELSATVQRLGELLQSPQSSLETLQATSQQLYDWIIRPLETELAANDIDHLIFVNDRVTRYIPMAALYDGEQYLLERYRISTVLAPGLTDTTDRLTEIDQSQVLGLGVTDAVADFNPLPAVGDELDAIVRSDAADPVGIYPGQVFLNDDFTLDALKTNVRDARVLHLATHAAFVPGRADESFILLGNGDPLKVNDIEAMHRRLSNLHMVVLSACQTALGGQAGDGTEIAGISAYFLEAGRAETVIASLWSVNDGSTSLLMQRFYKLLATGELTKAEALRQAQIALIERDFSGIEIRDRRDDGTVIAVDRETGLPPAVSNNLSHPYYWAPFILIGNGL